jgi:hypothetical protein
MSRLVKEKKPIPLPDNPMPKLVDLLMDAGPVMHGPMGSAPLPPSEILAWQKGAGVELTRWEFRMIRTLSAAYLGELQEAREHSRPAPWVEKPKAEQRVALAKRIKSLFR